MGAVIGVSARRSVMGVLDPGAYSVTTPVGVSGCVGTTLLGATAGSWARSRRQTSSGAGVRLATASPAQLLLVGRGLPPRCSKFSTACLTEVADGLDGTLICRGLSSALSPVPSPWRERVLSLYGGGSDR